MIFRIHCANPISIHAPARGATYSCFPPPAIKVFQSTLPHGERRRSRKTCTAPPYFNPRSRTGSDKIQQMHQMIVCIFQSTLPHGERRWAFYDYKARKLISIHAPARGATIAPIISLYLVEISIHAPARGATDKIYFDFNITLISIHAPARGATRLLLAFQPLGYVISIHAPARGATV